MVFLIVDLEWNGAWSKKAHGYFNEIIEIGAVKLDDNMQEQGRFHAVIRPQVSKKLSALVTDLTSITDEELTHGVSFQKAMAGLRRFAGQERERERALVTWSTTDLLVMMENCRFFYGSDRLGDFTHYADLQAYCQNRLGIEPSRQPSLDRICEQLSISEEGLSLHRAPDDALLTAQVCRRLYEPAAFAPYLKEMDDEFYARVNFKITPITDPESEWIPPETWQFFCPDCGRPMKRNGKWQYRGRAFCAELSCGECGRKYTGRVQARLKYEGPEIRRKLVEKRPPEQAAPTPPPCAKDAQGGF